MTVVSDGATNDLRGIGYSSNGTAHAVPTDAETWVTDNLQERVAALCGAGFPADTQFHSINGIKLTHEFRDGYLCDQCLQHLRDRGATIPGFIVGGKLVGEAARLVQSPTNELG